MTKTQVAVYDGSNNFVAQLGSTKTYTVTSGNPASAKSTVPATFYGVAGQNYSVQVTVKDANSNAITGLTSSNFGLTYGTSNLALTSVTASSSTNGLYTLTFTLPSGATSQTLTYNVEGYSIGTTAVTVGTPLSADTTATPNTGVSAAIAADANAPSGAVATPATNGALSTGGTYAMLVLVADATAAHNYDNLASSAFSVKYGTSTTNLVTQVDPTGTAGTYLVYYTAPTTSSTSAQSLNVAVAGITQTAGSYTIGQQASATKSSVTWMSGSSVVAGQSVSVTAQVKDASGNVISGLTLTNLGVFFGSSTSSAVTGATESSSTPGTYTVTFTAPTTVTASAESITMTANAAGTATSTDTVIGTDSNVSVVAGAPKQILAGNSSASATTALASGVAGTQQALTFTVEDTNNNPVANDQLTITLSNGSTLAAADGTISASSSTAGGQTSIVVTTDSSGVATVYYTPGSAYSGTSPTTTDSITATDSHSNTGKYTYGY